MFVHGRSVNVSWTMADAWQTNSKNPKPPNFVSSSTNRLIIILYPISPWPFNKHDKLTAKSKPPELCQLFNKANNNNTLSDLFHDLSTSHSLQPLFQDTIGRLQSWPERGHKSKCWLSQGFFSEGLVLWCQRGGSHGVLMGRWAEEVGWGGLRLLGL